MMDLTEEIKEKARDIGFDKIGITDASPLPESTGHHLRRWLKKGYHGDLEYLERSADKRLSPAKVVEGARSIISVALNYYPGDGVVPGGNRHGRISRYALGADYHSIIPEKLEQLIAFIRKRVDKPVRGSIFCDTGPLMEKAIAERAGLGWIGKHGILITREFGSWVFLGELVVDIPLRYDTPAENLCSSCILCMQACPTKAIASPGVVDISRCISYQTVENRGAIPQDIRSAMGNWIYGCDCCQECCPYNSVVVTTREQSFLPRAELVSSPLDMLFAVAVSGFKESFGDSAIARIKEEGLLRNIIVAMGNSGQSSFIPLLRGVGKGTNTLLAEHAEWAIERIAAIEREREGEMG